MNKTIDTRAIAYQRPQPTAMAPDLLLPGAVDADGDPETWIPQSENVWFRPLLLNVSGGYYVNLLKVRKSGILSRHRHSGPVHAFTLRGEWHYLEHDWVARPGDYAFEPPGETHTLLVPEDVEEMEDVFTKLDKVIEHYERTGLGRERAEALVR